VAHQQTFATHGIEVDVAAYRPKIAFIFDQLARESPLKQMARASVSSGILISIGGQQSLHAAGEIWTRRAEK